ncbi:unnamed protein product [Prunus armeniaca]|uniref:Uncharacterized protein n=1 Tax=Prunus armeniaca TaxID=36596 RepID=A0A6J5U476_PRUAR|nr:unnamed protein product [Prunus armeniaca]CAB4301401.1 unnamed protein product [Prunus armeniaca]
MRAKVRAPSPFPTCAFSYSLLSVVEEEAHEEVEEEAPKDETEIQVVLPPSTINRRRLSPDPRVLFSNQG